MHKSQLGWLGNLNIKLKKQKPLSMSIVRAMWLVYIKQKPLVEKYEILPYDAFIEILFI